MLADTRESAANALKASKAYQDIVDSIEGAINMSKVANAVSEKALQLVLLRHAAYRVDYLLFFSPTAYQIKPKSR